MDWYMRLGWANTSIDSDMSLVERGIEVPSGPGLSLVYGPDRTPYNHRKRKRTRRKPKGYLPLADPRLPLRSEQALPDSAAPQPLNDLSRI